METKKVLAELAKIGKDKKNKTENEPEKVIEKSAYRIEVLKKIEQLELF